MSSGTVNGTPPAFGRAAQRREQRHEQTPEAAQDRMARVIGEHVAVQLAQILGPLLQQVTAQPGCVYCVQARKAAERAFMVAVANAQQAGEEPPAPPEMPGIQQAVTWMPAQAVEGEPRVALPVCYGHYSVGPGERQVGLVDVSGRPIVARMA